MTGLPDVRSLFDLSGRVALVTGASRGLGYEMACGFAAAGGRVILSSRKADACEAAAAAIRADGGDATAFQAHAGEPPAMRVPPALRARIDERGALR